jgi:hypothetical protein
MTTVGQIIGIAAGVVLGFVTGGAGWALVGSIMMGAAAGYAVGSAIDPTNPDMPAPGQSAMGKLDIPYADEGVVVADAMGTCKAVGNFFFYGGNRLVELTQEVEGGKGGGSQTQKVGEEYYLSWCQGICLGPVDELYTIFRGDNVVWQGNVKREDATDGYQVVTITGVGTMYFFFGGNDHSTLPRLDALLPAEFKPPHNGLCWAFFDDCLIGSYNRAPAMKFVFRKTPDYDWSADNRIGSFDYNPAHALWYLIDIATEVPVTMLDETSFSTVASTLGLENRGVSMYLGEERHAMIYMENILTHIGGILQFEADGKFHLSLMRDDVDEDDMLSYTEDDFVSPPSLNRKTFELTVNDVRVQYSKRVDRPFSDSEPVEVTGNGDVYVMGFIDEATCASGHTLEFCDNLDNTGTYTWDGGDHCNESVAPNSVGTALAGWDRDVALYFDSPSGGDPKTKDWLLPGAAHISVLCHVCMDVTNSRTGWCPIAPGGHHPGSFCDLYDFDTESDYSSDVDLWKVLFLAMIGANGKAGYVPGSVLRVYLDTSSMGGIAALEPAYSQFKAWVRSEYGGLLYMEYENNTERWIHNLHEDLTPWGYRGGL